jgi:hypothetical protein
MHTFSYLFSDHVWLWLLEFLVAAGFIRAIFYDARTLMRRRRGGTQAVIKRGGKSWSVLLSFWALSIIIIEIILSSDLIASHRVIIGLLNVVVLVYLNFFSGYFKNRIIVWLTKVQDWPDRI